MFHLTPNIMSCDFRPAQGVFTVYWRLQPASYLPLDGCHRNFEGRGRPCKTGGTPMRSQARLPFLCHVAVSSPRITMSANSDAVRLRCFVQVKRRVRNGSSYGKSSCPGCSNFVRPRDTDCNKTCGKGKILLSSLSNRRCV